jgi:hypothetical protein
MSRRWGLLGGGFALIGLSVTTAVGAARSDSRVADAAMEGNREVVRALLTEGADVNAAQGDGMTALHWAARRGDASMVQMLVYAGANLKATTRLEPRH